MKAVNNNNNNNNNNNSDTVYGGVIMTQIILRVHLVKLMNVGLVEQRQVAADSQTKPTGLDCESACRLLMSTST